MKFNFRIRLFVGDEYKPLRLIPLALWALLAAGVAGQLAFHHYLAPEPRITARDFSQPPSAAALRATAFGDYATLSKVLALWVQAFDNQPGASIPFNQLDYDALGQWLDRAVALDARAAYPHFLMSKIYTATHNEPRRRKSVAWVRRHFLARPDARYEWMTYIANFAKYELKDDDLAFALARQLNAHTTPGAVPDWVRQLEIYYLQGHDQFEAAADLLLARLQAGEVTEPQEFIYLSDQLERLLKDSARARQLSREEFNRRIDIIENLRADFLQQHGVTAEA